MIRSLFRRCISDRDALFAEAQALLEDGLDVDFVLGLYPADAEWLEPLLRTADHVTQTLRSEEPSYYFEASLKNRFIAAGQERAEESHAGARGAVAMIATGTRAAAAGMAVVAVSGLMGVVALAFVTADQAVPGDWNYAFKRAGERMEYVLASEPERVNVDLKHKQERVSEFQRLVTRGESVKPDQIARLRKDLEEVAEIEKERPLDPVQRAHVRAMGESTTEILTTLRERQPELDEDVERTITVAAAIAHGGVSALPEPEPTTEPTREPTPTATPTPEPTATPTPEPTATPTPDPTPTPTPDPTPTRNVDAGRRRQQR